MTNPTSPTGEAPPRERAALSVLGWTSFAMPLVVSVLANLTWGVGTGSVVLIVAGLASPLLLVLAVERWRALPGLTGWARAVQVVGMAVVAAVAAGWSWVHTTDLLLDATRHAEGLPETAAVGQLPWLLVVLCVVAPLAVDGLAVLSVLTLAAGQPRSRDGGHESAPDDAVEGGHDVPDVAPEQAWGPADTVPAPPSPARRLSSVPGQRTKRELEAAARELKVPRKARESVEKFRERVEHAERARAHADTRDGATA